jgi:RNA polymerase sigma-70 factor (ECF subfamily)
MSSYLLEARLKLSRSGNAIRHSWEAEDVGPFVALCERYRARLWRIVASVARDCDADDLAQEAIIRAYCARNSYRGEASFEAWLCRIAINVAHDYQRSAWKRRVLCWSAAAEESLQAHPAPDEEAVRREMQRRIRKSVAALPQAQSTPIWLHYFESFSISEIAQLEATSESTIRSRIRAGLRRLSRSLSGYLESFACDADCSELEMGGETTQETICCIDPTNR